MNVLGLMLMFGGPFIAIGGILIASGIAMRRGPPPPE
jgi:hypothetical protein